MTLRIGLASTVSNAKPFMIIFSITIALSGMYKFRAPLGGQIGAQRYFYFDCVSSIWFCFFGIEQQIKALAHLFGCFSRNSLVANDKKHAAIFKKLGLLPNTF
jgi:hypothetical protein